MCSAERMRSVARERSATMPTKNGEIIAARAVVPAASPICSPVKFSAPSQVPIVTYQAPQTKYWRNINAESFTLTSGRMLAIRCPLSASTPPGIDRPLRQDDARQQIDRGLQALVHR